MPKFTEQTLDGWRKPASETEEQKISNAISMIKDAINLHDTLKSMSIEIIVQGSYGNNTNIKIDSDIDVCAMLKDTFYYDLRDGATKANYNIGDGTNDFADYRKYIIEVLIKKFGIDHIVVGNKSIQIKSNTYRVQADVIPAFQYRNYRQDKNNDINNFTEGIKFISAKNETVINYPKQHIQNGISKNTNTTRKFKRAIRLYKCIKNKMIEDGLPVPKSINPFLIEGLLWNTPNNTFTNSSTWNDLLKNSIIFLYNNTDQDEKCKVWGEVSEFFYLFHSERKWNRTDVNSFLLQMWKYLEYNQ